MKFKEVVIRCLLVIPLFTLMICMDPVWYALKFVDEIEEAREANTAGNLEYPVWRKVSTIYIDAYHNGGISRNEFVCKMRLLMDSDNATELNLLIRNQLSGDKE